MSSVPTELKLGLSENWKQFSLLVLVNAFVGGMVGLERAILPILAEDEFGIASKMAILSFIVTFGLAKAVANLFAGTWADRYGRKKVLVAGWLVGIPVPLLIMWAPSWSWVVAANLLLGVNQGLAWSSTVVMKIDLVGPKRRGFAMGLNESAGYVAVSIAALASGYIAAAYSIRPYPFILGLVFAVLGLILTLLFVRETKAFASLEAQELGESEVSMKDGRSFQNSREVHSGDDGVSESTPPSFKRIFKITSWENPTLFSVSQSGLVNNLNDGMVWGLFPIYFASLGFTIQEIGFLAALYPAVWGIGQLGTGALSDKVGRKPLIVLGMLIQAIGIGLILIEQTYALLSVSMVLLGAGTALVYPTLLAAIGDVVHPSWRASSIGVYRLWRDGGYVIGALMAGILSDAFGIVWAIGTIGILTALSGIVASFVMTETRQIR
ncbi:MAG: MFS transporter [Bacteroidetes bacterium]|nr:MFS transporter [Bacteroidota bacterium]